MKAGDTGGFLHWSQVLDAADESSSSMALPAAAPSAEEEASAAAYGEALEDVVLYNTHQFYKWYAELETARASETEEKYRKYADTLGGHLRTCQEILGQVFVGVAAGWLAWAESCHCTWAGARVFTAPVPQVSCQRDTCLG